MKAVVKVLGSQPGSKYWLRWLSVALKVVLVVELVHWLLS